jgi:hypothetical protein
MGAHLLNSILQLRASMSEILKSADNRPIEERIRGWSAITSGELGLHVDGRTHRMIVKHASMIKKLMSILPLMKKEPIRSPNNLNAMEVVKRTHILDSELSTTTISKLSKELRSARRQDNIIHVEEQVGGETALVVDDQRSIGASGAKAKLMEKRCDALVPSTGRLLEPIQ